MPVNGRRLNEIGIGPSAQGWHQYRYESQQADQHVQGMKPGDAEKCRTEGVGSWYEILMPQMTVLMDRTTQESGPQDDL
ncbi:MAG: hypothetical protein FD153_1817 [Rhodospirillaceae bacterium]|nr:MAG: hypothetical protein FD153_1817 [Rhodospirillaceae bacterium]